MSKILSLFNRLSFWGFVFTLTSLCTLATLFVITSLLYAITGNVNNDTLLLLTTITSLVTSFVIFFLLAKLLDRLHKENQLNLNTLRKEENLNRLFQHYLDTTDVMILALDSAGNITQANKAMLEEIQAKNEEELIGLNWLDNFVPEADLLKVEKVFSELMQGNLEQYKQFENTISLQDGTIKTVAWNNECIQDQFGNIIGTLSSGKDVTQERKVQQDLKEQRNLLRTVVDEIPDPVMLKDAEGKFLLANKTLADLYQTTPEKMIGKDNADFIPDKKLAKYYTKNVQAIMRRGKPEIVYEDSIDMETGEYRHYRSIKKPFKNSLGENQILVLAYDITPLKKVENELRQRDRYQRALLDNFPFMVWLKDTNSQYLAINKPMATKSGLETPDDAIGKTDFDFYPQPLAKQYVADDKAVMQSRKHTDIEEPFIGSDGDKRWIETYKAPLLDEDGKPFGTVGFARDITEQKNSLQDLYLTKHALQHIHDAYYLMSPDASFLEVNQAATDMLGYTKSELLNMSVFDINPSFPKKDWPDLLETIKSEGSKTLETIHRTKEGQNLMVDIAGSFLQFEGKDYYLAIVRDITQQKRNLKDIYLLQHALANIDDAYYLISQDTRLLKVNQAAAKELGYSMSELEEMSVGDVDYVYPIETFPEFWAHISQEGATRFESGHQRKDGSQFPVEIISNFITYEGEEYVLSIARNITQQKQQEKLLKDEKTRFTLAVEGSQDGIWDWDLESGDIFFSSRYIEILGYANEEFHFDQESWIQLVHPDDIDKVHKDIQKHLAGDTEFFENKHRMLKKSGDWIWVKARGKALFNESNIAIRLVGFLSDITEETLQQEKLDHIAKHDILTDLPNRFLLNELLQSLMSRCERNQSLLAVLYLDLDGFKEINDIFGHAAGDTVLIKTTQRIRETLRLEDLVARIGGDEFVIVFPDLKEENDIGLMIHRLLDYINLPISLDAKNEDDMQVQVSASIGVSFYPQSETMGSDALLRQADQAMYKAKTEGKNQYRYFDSVEDETAKKQKAFILKFVKSLRKKRMRLFYQPKVNVANGDILGFEALLRWDNGKDGILSPDAFLPMINTNPHLMKELGIYVFELAFVQLTEWVEQGLELHLSINISAHELHSIDTVSYLKELIKKHPKVNPNLIELEILETSALQDTGIAMKRIKQFQALGVKVSLDDFGTGYSSLSNLKNLPVDTLKIDRTFVSDINDDASRSIIEASIGLAHAFGCATVAEGVETQDQCHVLMDLGCDFAQGYFISKPLPANEVINWLTHWKHENICREVFINSRA